MSGTELERGTLVDEDVGLEAEEELWTDDTSGDHAGWFCVATDPFRVRPRAARSSRST